MGKLWKHAAENDALISAKLAFFFIFFGSGCTLPFMNVFLMSIGLCPTQVGLITGFRSLTQAIAAPIWGIIADKTRRHQLIAVLLYVGAIFTMLPQPWLASALSPIAQHRMSDRTLDLKNSTTKSEEVFMIKECSGNTTTLFRTMIIIAMIFAVFDSAMNGMVETITMGKIRFFQIETSFGRQRVFGSVGFGLAAAINSGAASLFHVQRLSSYTPLFINYSLAMFSLVILSHFLFKNCNEILYSSQEDIDVDRRKIAILSAPKGGMRGAYFVTVTQFRTLFFFVTVLLMGIANGLYFGYMPAYLEQMKAPRVIIGLSIVVSSMAEMITLPISGSFIKFLGGEMAAMGVATIAYSFRFFALSIMENPWMLIAIQAINIVAFPLFWAACIQHTHKISSREIYTSMFTTVNGIHYGAGSLVSNALGGVLFDKLGGQMLFRFVSLVYMAWPLVICAYIVLTRCFGERNPYEKVSTDEPEQQNDIFDVN